TEPPSPCHPQRDRTPVPLSSAFRFLDNSKFSGRTLCDFSAKRLDLSRRFADFFIGILFAL
ncbi:MAG: hypothetical protein WCR27_05915, partial [Eubacteriales bacterium]